MRVCDKCGDRMVAETIVKSRTEEEIDLCEKCLQQFEEFRRPIVKTDAETLLPAGRQGDTEKKRDTEKTWKKKDGAN